MIVSDDHVRAAILEFLIKKARWGAHYFPFDTLVNWMGRKVDRDGKRVGICLKELAKQGYVLMHKRGETVSLNPAMTEKIRELINRRSPPP
jgi:hypothetical protein